MKTFRRILGGIFIIGGFALAAYLGLWEMFIKPIMDACAHFDEGTLTGMIIGKTVLKCVFASAVSGITLFTTSTIGTWLIEK